MRKRISDNEKYKLVARFYKGESVTDICLQTGIARSTFYSWIKPYKTINTKTGQAVSPAEFAKMKQRIAKLEEIVEILKTVDCTVSSPLKVKLEAMESLYDKYSVHALCNALAVPRGTFYNHIFRSKRENSTYQLRRDQLSEEIRQVYEESKQIYGAKKITAVLREQGIITSDKMVSELMQEMNLHSIRTEAKKNYIHFDPEKKTDHLKMKFSVSRPNQVWVSDTTYFKVKGKGYYICAIIDLYSRKVIAHKISDRHSTRLVTAAFRLAYADRQPAKGLIFHSDRGAQYVAYAFQKLLRSYNVKQSFSPSGKPHHNAVMESFFSSLKKEELYRTNYHSVVEFKERVNSYIQFYNTKRPHATLGYKAPEVFETMYPGT